MIRNDILESFTFRLLAQGMKDRHAAAIVATLKDLGGRDVWREMERYCDSELRDQGQWDGRFEQAVAIIRTMVEQLKNLGGDGLASGADAFLASLETPAPEQSALEKVLAAFPAVNHGPVDKTQYIAALYDLRAYIATQRDASLARRAPEHG